MKRLVLLLFVCFLLYGLSQVHAASDLLSVTVTYKSSYDSNVLTYSDSDRARFENGTELYVSPVRTLDDLRNDFKLSLSSKFQLFPKLYTRLYLTTNFAGYLNNSIKNFGWTSLTARQDLSNQLRLSANYFYEPRYFIRDYSDVHSGTRQHCDFAQSQWKGELRYRPTDTWEFTAIGRFKLYAYNEYFTEYDSDFRQFGLESVYRVGDVRLTGAYHMAINDNVGFDEATQALAELNEDNESGQGDYEQDQYEFSINYRFKFAGRTANIFVSEVFEERYYSTNLSPVSDPIHHGRRDRTFSTDIGLNYSFNKLVGLEIGFQQKNRRSRASDDVVEKVKNYDRWLGYFEISYELW